MPSADGESGPFEEVWLWGEVHRHPSFSIMTQPDELCYYLFYFYKIISGSLIVIAPSGESHHGVASMLKPSRNNLVESLVNCATDKRNAQRENAIYKMKVNITPAGV
ncbi:uncharacterized protein ACOB8E_000667 isoform 1-T2 [Sarcophilus harrisii]